MRKGAVLCAGAVLALAGQAQAFTLGKPVDPCWLTAHSATVINQTGIGSAKLLRVEHAVEIQSRQVAAVWHTPCVRFVPQGGWLVYLTRWATPWCESAAMPTEPGCHTVEGGIIVNGIPSGPPIADIAVMSAQAQGYASWTVDFSHEIIEMVSDPNGSWFPFGGNAALEICDAFYDSSYEVAGVRVSDWGLPVFYRHPFTTRPVSFDGAY